MAVDTRRDPPPATVRPSQMPTRVPGLDRLMSGGLRRGGLHVVLGGPGTGKSVLAHQIGASVVRDGGRVLYLTALVETHQTLIAQARTFRFFDPGAVAETFYYASLHPTLARSGLVAAREEMSRLVAERDPTLIVLDGVHALKIAAADGLEYQQFMHEMEAQSAVTGVTTLLLAHPPQGGIATDPTFTIGDAILEMSVDELHMRSIRAFAVRKLRGVSHIGGSHHFRITADGVHIFPRLEALAAHMREHVVGTPPDGKSGQPLEAEVEGLTSLLGGGLDPGTCTLIVGTPGSGKTLTALAFLTAGAARHEPGLYVGYHERPAVLVQKAEGIGLPLGRAIAEQRVIMDWTAPAELLADEEAERLLALIERHGIRRMVIDSLEDIRLAVAPPSREPYFLPALINSLKERDVTIVVTHDLPRIVGVNLDLPLSEVSALMDNVIHLRYVEMGGALQRLIAVLKVRSRGHDHALRELHIAGSGMRVGRPIDGAGMTLTGLGLPR